MGGENVPRVLIDLTKESKINENLIQKLGYQYIFESDKWEISEMGSDYIYIGKLEINFNIPGTLGVIQDYKFWQRNQSFCFPLYNKAEYLSSQKNNHPKLQSEYLFFQSIQIQLP